MNPTTSDRGKCRCEKPILFGDVELGEKRHICAFFNSAEEEYRVLMPFIREGIELGEKAFHVVSPGGRARHLQRMVAGGVDVVGAQYRGQFELYDWEEMYLPDGRFDQYRMLAAWDGVIDRAVSEGFERTRVVAHMEWGLDKSDGAEDLLEYEARFNLRTRDRDPVICTYDLNLYGAAFIVDVMRTHPVMLAGGILQENPFYVQPEEFIRELQARKAMKDAAAT